MTTAARHIHAILLDYLRNEENRPRRCLGLWGTVLAQHLSQARPKVQVSLWEFFETAAAALARTRRHPHIPGFRLDDSVAVTSNLFTACAEAAVILFFLPSGFVRRTASAARAALGLRKPLIVNASKGIEPGTLRTMGDILSAELRSRAVYTLSGPSFAREVARGIPTRLILAGPAGPASAALRALFDGGALSVELSGDRRGVELGGSLKNVLAIGAGMLDGLSRRQHQRLCSFRAWRNEPYDQRLKVETTAAPQA